MTDMDPTRGDGGPSVSIVMAVRNGERFLRPAIDSVLAQTFRDWELIVVNDHSTDSTAEILAAYAGADPRIRPVRLDGEGGAARARNFGIESAAPSAGFFAILDADDRMLPTRLERQLQFMRANPGVFASACWAYIIDVAGKRIGTSTYCLDHEKAVREADASACAELVHSGVMMQADRTIGYRQPYSPLEDRELWCRQTALGRVIVHMPEILCEYRLHSGSITLSPAKSRAAGDLIEVNFARVLRGERELTLDEYSDLRSSRTFIERFSQQRVQLAWHLYRAASRFYAERKLFETGLSVAGLLAIRPVWGIKRIRSKLASRSPGSLLMENSE